MRRVISWGRLGCVLALGTIAGCFDDASPADAGTTDAVVTTDNGAPTDAGATDAGATDAGGNADVAPTGTPTVSVSVPAANATLPIGAPTQLTLAVTNFVLTNFVGTTSNRAGFGHVHVYLDAADNNDYLLADYITRPRVVIPNGTSVGPHTLRVSLRNNDHSALTPPVQVVVPFMAATNTAPAVIINAPADNTNVMAGADLTMMLSFMNFMPRPYAGQSGVNPPYGHYHVYLDGASGSDYLIATEVANPMVRIPAGTTAGAHRLTVSLRNDDHSEIVGSSADLRINVTN